MLPKLAEASEGASLAQITASLGSPVQGSAMSRIRPQSSISRPLWCAATAVCMGPESLAVYWQQSCANNCTGADLKGEASRIS